MKQFIGLLALAFLASCSPPEDGLESSIVLDPGLPLDANGYYHLKITDSKRVIHEINGELISSDNMRKQVHFDADACYINPGQVKAGYDWKFKTTISPEHRMQGDTITLRARVFLGNSAAGEPLWATTTDKIILE